MTEKMIHIQVPELEEREKAIYDIAQVLVKEQFLSTMTVIKMFNDYVPGSYDTTGNRYIGLKKDKRKWYDEWISKVEGLGEQLESYFNFNSSYKDHIASAIILGRYTYSNHISEGDIVFCKSKGIIGYAGVINYKDELFPLYSSEGMETWSYVGVHDRKDFVKVGLRKK